MSKIIGIDLGTTKSTVAVLEGGTPVVIARIPSAVAFENERALVGEPAKRAAAARPDTPVFSPTRLLRWHDQDKRGQFSPSSDLVNGPDGSISIQIGGRRFTPDEIVSMLLTNLREAAEEYLGDPVAECVMTLPLGSGDDYRVALKRAASLAGLEILRFVRQSTATGLAYGFNKTKDETIAVFDFGGGTLDLSILEVGEGVVEEKATGGDPDLGGDNLDVRIIEWVIAEFKKSDGIDLGKDRMALQRLKEAGEKAKMELSSVMETDINLPFIAVDASSRPKHLQMSLTRAKFEQLVEDLLQKTVGPTKQALADAGVDPLKIDEVVLVGGSTRIPKVQTIVREIFGKEPHEGVNPDEVVAVGAAIQAGVLAGDVKELLLLDVTELSLGIETMGGVMTTLIQRNTTIPTRKSEVFSTASDNQTSVEVHVLQGERPLARDNRTLGRFHLVGLAPAPCGVPEIEVTLDIDGDDVKHVTAKDLAGGSEVCVALPAKVDKEKHAGQQSETALAVFVSRSSSDPDFEPRGDGRREPVSALRRRCALLIGINRYRDADFEPLRFAERDASELADLLQQQYGFTTRVLAGEAATRTAIRDVLESGTLDAALPPFSADDQLLLFFAGHGEVVDGQYVLHPWDGTPGRWIDALPMKYLNERMIHTIPCREIMCVLDACRSQATAGARGGRGFDGESFARDVRVVLDADPGDRLVQILYGCSEGERSWEDERLAHGVLTQHLMRVLENARDNLSFLSLAERAVDQVATWRHPKYGYRQTPHLYHRPTERRIWLRDADKPPKGSSSRPTAQALVGEGSSDPNAFIDAHARSERKGERVGRPLDRVERLPGGEKQRFEGVHGARCALYRRHTDPVAYCVRGDILQRYRKEGGSQGPLGFPKSDEKGLEPNIYGTLGRWCEFEGGAVYFHAVSRRNERLGRCFVLRGKVVKRYQEMGGPESALGFPISDVVVDAAGAEGADFEGGKIVRNSGAVQATVIEAERRSRMELTMSNPHYETDLHTLDGRWQWSDVIADETVFIVTGWWPACELLDRSAAEWLRDEIDRRGNGAGRRAIVISDQLWFAEPSGDRANFAPSDIRHHAVIAIGGPRVNRLAEDLALAAPSGKEIGVATAFDPGPPPRVALWGDLATETRTRVEQFIADPHGLEAFLGKVWH